ncbi:RsmB/NOP family class I SAM-dependent RNA methyltransferase [Falsiroseomonas selenitidurans]|uniref:RsmB/NOP family class I SAM-dependent RNA methyltransferase n=1 Tax=Falsiroseomonas selenitidurans TaxID=2716335 RepID=A0ABX1E968_9PROT|nr:RsmB/NOP family class I SAM-dependent RNA methyltransferase [Falsiroseomonas selenitidurans]NKC33770.1 RsmB/NOP family class I SAM-dependent RNA methyltransferase [Falsiroseomonas selenitidurans]
MTPAARLSAAIDLLAAVEASPRRPADAIANDFFRARRYIGGSDRRNVSERAWGAIRQRLRLAWHFAELGVENPPARLLLAGHLLLAEGWSVDGVDQNFSGERFAASPLTEAERDLLGKLAGRPLVLPRMPEGPRLNLPDWALPGLRSRFGESLAAEAAAMEAAAPLDLRANLLKVDREGALAALAAEGIPATPTPLSPWGLRIADRRPVSATKPFLEGLIEVQDEGSQLIALVTDARPGMRVADFCAGAAGKTLALAATMGNRGHIVACDTSASRLEGAGRRLRRADVHNSERHLLTSGDKWRKRNSQKFDRVLVDAPCTGTGTWRRNPDARIRTNARDLAELVLKQAMILEDASELVRPGGRLVYATCSLLPEEDEMQMAAFLERHEDFEALPLPGLWAELRPGLAAPGDGPWMALSPARHGTDGFFAAVLQRRPT